MARFNATLLAAMAVLCTLSPAIAVPNPGTIGFGFTKCRVSDREAASLARRQSGTLQAGLDNGLILYLINVTVGTHPQRFSLQLDTGSSDIWFPATQSNVCQRDQNQCPFGTYSASDSSSVQIYEDLPPFHISYVDGTNIEGSYISDVLEIGSTRLTNMTMAAATQLNSVGIGIMGVGLDFGESGAQISNLTYPNVIDILQSEGFINRRAYSLWLDDIKSLTGSILFGGVDTDKYHGDLIALPIQPDSRSNQIESFSVAWTGLSIHGSGNNLDMSPQAPTAAILDSGSTIMLLPDDIANNILTGVGADMDQDYGAVVPCTLAEDDIIFSFTFGGQGGATVNVSLSEFVSPIFDQDGNSATFQNGDQACTFGVQAANGNPIILGDTFLRSAYVVYNLEDRVIGLAQTDFNAKPGPGNVRAFDVSASDIPGVTSTATVTAEQTFSGNPRVTQESASGTGQIQASGGSATFQLSPTGLSGGNTATSSGAANSSVKSVGVEAQSFVVMVVVLASYVFGDGQMFMWTREDR